MKFALFLLCLLPFTSDAALKWETTRKTLTYKPGTALYRTSFTFKNTGKTAVSITDIKTGCVCCTHGSVKKRAYAPGETGQVDMKIDVAGKEVPTVKPIIVEFSGGTDPVTLILEIKTADGAVVKIPRANTGGRK